VEKGEHGDGDHDEDEIRHVRYPQGTVGPGEMMEIQTLSSTAPLGR
jgi:hypothetical protein